jgi:hypothetical protein
LLLYCSGFPARLFEWKVEAAMKRYFVWSPDHPEKIEHYLTPVQAQEFRDQDYFVEEA